MVMRSFVIPRLNAISRNISHQSVNLKQILEEKIPEQRERVKIFKQKCGKLKISDINVDMMYRGMRGLTSIFCETSTLDPMLGIHFRNHTLNECVKLLPKADDGFQPLPEGMFWLLLTGDIPNRAQVKMVTKMLSERAELPQYVTNMIFNFPIQMPPISQFSIACTTLNAESKFAKAYSAGSSKSEYWEHIYEDSLDLIAKLPVAAAAIYRNTYGNDQTIEAIDPTKDWACNFTKMLSFDSSNMFELMRLFLTIHSDHGGGNVSKHTTHLVGSALADPYLSFASGINGLAGPLHGAANQEMMIFLMKIMTELGSDFSDGQLEDFIKKHLDEGLLIPGYGHTILRNIDTRYICQKQFANNHMPHDPMVKILDRLQTVVPPILKATGKVQNPWPNADAYSGVLFSHYGLKQIKFYPVLSAISRSLGTMASLIWDRALGLPIERPKSMTSEQLMKACGVTDITQLMTPKLTESVVQCEPETKSDSQKSI